jgi:tRNA C32,U32 (ribose-2'-O)-methylase TrmJ
VDFGELETVEGVVKPIDIYVERGFTPVAVEVLPSSESLVDFVHPHNALYIFGPEDGSLTKGIKEVCHRFVSIPSKGCLNLGAAVNVVLYDRLAKATAKETIAGLRETIATLREEGVG